MKRIDRPNILLVMADSLAPHFTSPHGDRAGATPNIQRLANEGVLFERAYCNSPMCAPSRASMVTGRYVGEIGAFDNANEFSSDWPSVGHALGAVGYETLIIGKMHFVGHDQWHGFEQRLAHQTDYTSKYNPGVFAIAYDWTQPSAGNPAGSSWMGPSYVKSAAWDHYTHHYDRDQSIHAEALRYLGGRGAGSAPFFACVDYHAPHNPFWIPQPDRARFEQADMALPQALSDLDTCHGPMDTWLNDFHYVPEIRERLLIPDNLRWLYATFYGMVYDLDRRLGELMQLLEKTGLAESTAVIFTSDHGDMMGHRGMVQKRCFYERSLRVPWIWRFPGHWQGGARIARPVSLVDLMPTLADIAHAPLPAEMPGASLRGSLEAAIEPPERAVLAEYHGEGVHAPCYAAIRGDEKYVYVHGHEHRLYNLREDPDELRNRAGDTGSAAACAALRAEILRVFDPERTAARALASQRARAFIHRGHLARQRTASAAG